MEDVLDEILILEEKRRKRHPADWNNELLIVQKGCPYGKALLDVVREINMQLPRDRRIEVLYLDTMEDLSDIPQKTVMAGVGITDPIPDTIVDRYGSFKCPTLIFRGMMITNIYNKTHAYNFLKTLYYETLD